MELRDLKVGQYIRLNYGTIDKILELTKSYVQGVSQKETLIAYNKDNIIKASDKLIDLICEGDYIDGMKVFRDDDFLYVQCIYGDGELYCESITKQSFIDNIKSIVTKEMFDQMSYKVGE